MDQRSCLVSRCCRRGDEHNLVADSLQPLDQVTFQPFGIEAIEIVTPEVFAGAIGFEQVIGDEQDVVGNGDDRPFGAAPGAPPTIAGGQVGGLRAGCRPAANNKSKTNS